MDDRATAHDYSDPMSEQLLGLAADVLRSFGSAFGGRHLAKDEPLVWLVDALVGTVLAAERGDMTWLGELGEVTRTSLVRLPP